MGRDFLVELFEHKAWCDRTLAAALRRAPADVDARAMAVILFTFDHIAVVDRIFRAHLSGETHGFSGVVARERPDLDALAHRLAQTDAWYVDYVRNVSEAELGEVVAFAFTDGDAGRMTRGQMLAHVITHGASAPRRHRQDAGGPECARRLRHGDHLRSRAARRDRPLASKVGARSSRKSDSAFAERALSETGARMKCPNCGADLAKAVRDGVEAEACPACGGLWLSPQELDQLEDESFHLGDEEKGTLVFSSAASQRLCPVCEQPLKRFEYRLYDLELEFCAAGHGFWLDAGEDRRVRQLMSEEAARLQRADRSQRQWTSLMRRLRSASFFQKLRDLMR